MYPTYMPVLQAKKGELDGLANTPGNTLRHIFPVIEIPSLSADYISKTKKYREHPAPLTLYLNERAKSLSGLSSSLRFFFDIRAWSPDASVESGEHIVSYFSRSLTDLGVTVNPVVNYGHWDDPEYRTAITSLPTALTSNFLIRLSGEAIEDLDDPGYFCSRIEEILSSLQVDASRIAVQVDFEDVTSTSPADIQVVVETAANLLAPHRFAFMALAGSSMPVYANDMVPQENSIALLLRREFNAWKALRSAYPQLGLVFGDYGVSSGGLSEGFPNPHANGKIRYTITDQYLIARGQSRLKGDKSAQFHRLSAIIMGSGYYMGPNFSWGDQRIMECATIQRGPGTLQTWVSHDTSHHLAFVTEELLEFNRTLTRQPGLAPQPIGASNDS